MWLHKLVVVVGFCGREGLAGVVSQEKHFRVRKNYSLTMFLLRSKFLSFSKTKLLNCLTGNITSNGFRTTLLSIGMPRTNCKVARTEFLSLNIKVFVSDYKGYLNSVTIIIRNLR